jgi:hypothetical protein
MFQYNMLAWILQMSIISITLIFLVHHLIYFFKSMLTIPKIKDLVDSPSQKYKNIFDQMKPNTLNATNTVNSEYTKVDLLPKEDSMKKDLKSFLKKQLNSNKSDNATDVYSMDSAYSPY